METLANPRLFPTPGAASVQSLSPVRLFVTPWTAARQASLSITNSRSLLRLMSMDSVMPSNRLILCRPLLLSPSAAGTVQTPNHKAALERTVPRSHHWEDGPSIDLEAIHAAQPGEKGFVT